MRKRVLEKRVMGKRAQFHPGMTVLIEVCILFLPAIPAYIWLWPNLEGAPLRAANIATHLYVLAGTLVIGLRRWNLDQLGMNTRGLWPALAAGFFVVLGRSLVIFSVDWGIPAPVFTPLEMAGEFVYYFAVIGFVQELLFRGLVYRAFEDWLGTRWAIWGTTFGFVLWHIGWGPLAGGAAMVLYGLIFALMRSRFGGILGLVITHGAMDFFAMLMLPDLDVLSLGRPGMPYPALALLGLALILLVPVALWVWHPRAGLANTFP